MNFSSPETWLDLIVAFVSIVAIIAAIIAARILWKEKISADLKESFQHAAAPAAKVNSAASGPKKPLIDVLKNQTPPVKTVKESIKPAKPNPVVKPKEEKIVPKLTVPTPPTSASKPVEKPAAKPVAKPIAKPIPPTTDMPKLIAERLALTAPNTLLLSLKNNGKKLIYKKLTTGQNNELIVNYESPIRKQKLIREEFETGSSMTFTMKGEKVISQTYQFTIFYSDMEGNLYEQQIAGMGKEYPIIDKPKKIA